MPESAPEPFSEPTSADDLAHAQKSAALAAASETEPANDAGEVAKPGWYRDVTIFLVGQTVSLFGSMLVQVAIIWHLTLVTSSGSVLGLASLFGFLPQAVISIFGGVWADRLNRKVLIIGADAAIAATTLTLALLMFAGHDDLWLIYGAMAIRSAGAGIQTPAVSAILPQLVPKTKLMRVNGINGTIQSAMMLLAPAAAAAVYASASIEAIFLVDVATAVIGIGLLLLIKVSRVERDEENPTGYFEDLRGGLRYLRDHASVRWILGLNAAVFVLIVAPTFLTPLLIVRTFGEEVWKLTVNETAFAVGMVIGGALLATWGGLKNRITQMLAAALAYGGLSIAMGLAGNLWLFFAFMGLVGLATPFFSTTSMTVLQETVEPDHQGRVFGFFGIIVALALPIGMMTFGPLADRFSVESLLVATGIMAIVVIIIAALLPSGRKALRNAHKGQAAG